MNCTVAIPVFNQRWCINDAVHSAIQQDPASVETLVVDNCSTDGTWEELQKYRASGVRLLRNERNLGLFGNFNRCLEAAASPYLRILCADDVLPTDCLREEIAILERHPGAAMLSTCGRYVDPEGRDMGPFANDFPAGIYDGKSVARIWFAYYAHYRRNPLNYPSGVMIRRSAAAGLKFDERYVTTGDVDFYLRLLEHGDLAVVDSLGCYVTRHASQAHAAPNLDGTAIREHLRLLERLGGAVGTDAERRSLRRQLGGMSLGLAAHRSLSAATRDSARVHVALAVEIAPGWLRALFGLAKIALCRLARFLFGNRAPYVPRPARSLESG